MNENESKEILGKSYVAPKGDPIAKRHADAIRDILDRAEQRSQSAEPISVGGNVAIGLVLVALGAGAVELARWIVGLF